MLAVKDAGRRRQADADHRGGDARPIVPERAFRYRGGLLCGRGARSRTRARASRARHLADRGRGRASRPRSRRAACCSTCTGSRMWSAASRSAGRGSPSARVVFGGRLLIPTAAADIAAAEAAAPQRSPARAAVRDR